MICRPFVYLNLFILLFLSKSFCFNFRDNKYYVTAFQASMKPGEIFQVPLGQKKGGKEGSKDISSVFDTSPFCFLI